MVLSNRCQLYAFFGGSIRKSIQLAYSCIHFNRSIAEKTKQYYQYMPHYKRAHECLQDKYTFATILPDTSAS